MLTVLRKGSTGNFVAQWQLFLRGQGYLIQVTRIFDDLTEVATKKYQKKYGLNIDGIVGNRTLGSAAGLGLEIVQYSGIQVDFPAEPTFRPLTNNAMRQQMFGPLKFEPDPTLKNPEKIRITNSWAAENIVRVTVPQLVGIEGAGRGGDVYFHRKAKNQLLGFWAELENRNLLKDVLSYAGDWVPRFVRGKANQQVLSNHAFGTAFDVNPEWNPLGAEPATSGKKGCVYGLVPIAHQFGFYWGGHFTRRDGMHFEIAELKA